MIFKLPVSEINFGSTDFSPKILTFRERVYIIFCMIFGITIFFKSMRISVPGIDLEINLPEK